LLETSGKQENVVDGRGSAAAPTQNKALLLLFNFLHFSPQQVPPSPWSGFFFLLYGDASSSSLGLLLFPYLCTHFGAVLWRLITCFYAFPHNDFSLMLFPIMAFGIPS
jgi:hypothetical protein